NTGGEGRAGGGYERESQTLGGVASRAQLQFYRRAAGVPRRPDQGRAARGVSPLHVTRSFRTARARSACAGSRSSPRRFHRAWRRATGVRAAKSSSLPPGRISISPGGLALVTLPPAPALRRFPPFRASAKSLQARGRGRRGRRWGGSRIGAV